MGKGIIFFVCSCCILVLTIVYLSIGPIISGKAGIVGTQNCEALKDIDESYTNDDKKYETEWPVDECVRKKAMHDMEYTSFIFDIGIGFVCSLIGLLHIFDIKKDFVSNTGLIGLICGVIGFILSFVYVIFNGLVYTNYYPDDDIYKTDGDWIVAEVGGSRYKCKYFDEKYNIYALIAKYSDLGKKQYNYNKDFRDSLSENSNCIFNSGNGGTDSSGRSDPSGGSEPGEEDDPDGGYADRRRLQTVSRTISLYENLCSNEETFLPSAVGFSDTSTCKNLYIHNSDVDSSIKNKDISDRFLTALILSLFVCLASIGIALFGFFLFRTPDDF